MKTLSSLFALAVSSATLFAPSLVNAQDWTFQPRVNVGIMKYTFEQEDLFTLTSPEPGIQQAYSLQGVKRSDWLPYIGIGGTISYDRFFLDIYGLKTAIGEQKDISQSSTLTTFIPDFSVTDSSRIEGDSDIDRSEYSIAVGYNVVDNLLVYVGYKESKTEFDNNIILTGAVGGSETPPTPGTVNQDLKQRGPFIGTAYGWDILDKGILSVNASVGSFKGEVKNTWNIEGVDSIGQDLDGDVIGLTLGVSWRGNITDSLGYLFAVSGYNYDYDSNKSNGADFSESQFNFSAGLSYRF